MKKKISWIVVSCLMVAALVLTSCGGAGTEEEEAVTEKGVTGPDPTPTYARHVGVGKYGGTLTIALGGDHLTFDPPLLSSSADTAVIFQIYESLLEHNPDFTYQPLLAESWEANEDLTQWTFYLRKGVKFHHGKEMKAEDVVFSIDRLFEMESPYAGALSMIEDVVAVDDYTVRFDLSSGTSFLPDLLTRYHVSICPSDIDPARFATEPIGTGPFIMTENVVGERTVFKKNPDYWWKGYPYLDDLVYIYLPDPQSCTEALKSGSVDYYRYTPISSVPEIEAYPGLRVSIVTGSSQISMVMDNTVEPFNNKLVRQALQAVTDREATNQACLFGYGTIAYDHPIPPVDVHFNPKAKPPEYNPELAKSLLEQAGYPDGIDLTLYTSTHSAAPMLEMATVMKEKAVPAGIRIEIEVMPEAGYWSDVWLKKPFCTVYWGGRIPDDALSTIYKSDAGWNESKYNNPRVDELIIKARSQVKLEDRQKTYGEIQEILVDEVPRIVPVFRPEVTGMRDNLKGIESTPNAAMWARYAWWDD